MDGEWEPPMIDNPEYKGEWAPKQVSSFFLEKLKKICNNWFFVSVLL